MTKKQQKKTVTKKKSLTFNACVELAANFPEDKENQELDCDLTLKVDGESFKAYTVTVCRGDLLFFTDKAAINYTVDIYDDGDRGVATLYDIDKSE